MFFLHQMKERYPNDSLFSESQVRVNSVERDPDHTAPDQTTLFAIKSVSFGRKKVL